MMTDAERYRRLAEDCRKSAAIVTDPGDRGRLLRMAIAWENCAAQAEYKARAGKQTKP